MKKTNFILFLVVFLLLAKPASAAVVSFSPATGTFAVGEAFKVDINVNTESTDTMSTDVVINYDNTLLKVDTVTYGTFYGTVLHSEKTNQLLISGMVSDATKVVNGSGILATVTFTPLTTGTTTLSFDCTAGKTNDTNVAKNDLNATDVVTCSSLTDATYTLGDGTTSISTSTDEEVEATVTEIPQTGGIVDYVSLFPKIFMGLTFLLAGTAALLII